MIILPAAQIIDVRLWLQHSLKSLKSAEWKIQFSSLEIRIII